MKALVYTGPNSMAYREVDDPVRAEDQQLIRVDSVGICGSDMHAWHGHDERRPPPLILGHEVAGHVVGGAQDGRRVTVNPLVSCGVCNACRSGRANLCADRKIISMPPKEGGFAEYIVMRDANLVTVPEGFSLEAASLAEPLACGWHAVRLAQRASERSLASSRCLVIGGGMIGVGAALVLKAFGAGEVYLAETHDGRRALAAEITGAQVFDPRTDHGLENTCDVVIDGVGFAPTRALSSACAVPGGVISHIGLGSAEGGLDIRRMTLQEITFIGTYTYTLQDFVDTTEAMFSGQLGALDWPVTAPLAEGGAWFNKLDSAEVDSPKVILKP